jgi:hypothetical protein
MNIAHHPLFNTTTIAEYYSEIDGVPVKYVCTSALTSDANWAVDIFYRETPHPKHGNRYFGIYKDSYNLVMICNADKIEDLRFSMIEGPSGWEYSQHRHDYRQVGQAAIDGGRSYVRLVGYGNAQIKVEVMKVKDGQFVKVAHEA